MLGLLYNYDSSIIICSSIIKQCQRSYETESKLTNRSYRYFTPSPALWEGEVHQILVHDTFLCVGFGSILSPSGDEDGSISDQELLRSPFSLGSCKGSSDGINTFDDDTLSSSPAPTDGETDYIDVDVDLSSPTHEHNKGMLSLPPPRVSSTTNKEAHKKKVGKVKVHVLF